MYWIIKNVLTAAPAVALDFIYFRPSEWYLTAAACRCLQRSCAVHIRAATSMEWHMTAKATDGIKQRQETPPELQCWIGCEYIFPVIKIQLGPICNIFCFFYPDNPFKSVCHKLKSMTAKSWHRFPLQLTQSSGVSYIKYVGPSAKLCTRQMCTKI